MATADLDTTLRRLQAHAPSRPLLVTDIGRSDLLLGLAAANESVPGPHTAGVLCTNGEHARREVGPHVRAILEVGGTPRWDLGYLGFRGTEVSTPGPHVRAILEVGGPPR